MCIPALAVVAARDAGALLRQSARLKVVHQSSMPEARQPGLTSVSVAKLDVGGETQL